MSGQTPSIRIDSSVKRILVNDDPARVIRFNPGDVVFAERFYNLLNDFQNKQAEYKRRAEIIDANKTLDGNGLPANLPDGIALTRDICTYLREQIDGLFGPGTSQAAFEDALSLDMFEQFFEGLTPFFKEAREERMNRYLNKQNAGRVME